MLRISSLDPQLNLFRVYFRRKRCEYNLILVCDIQKLNGCPENYEYPKCLMDFIRDLVPGEIKGEIRAVSERNLRSTF